MQHQYVAAPERPIRSKSDDLLDRAPFVERLCDALINRETGRSTGITIGLSGQWGSGKSSILNLLNERISERYKEAVVVRFDPWLVSGRDDLMQQFFLEFRASINEKRAIRERLSAIVEWIGKYSDDLAPLMDLKTPGFGTAFRSLFALGHTALRRQNTLHHQRETLLKLLQEANVPFVVLIDELDRIEDIEIRTIAQLVRAVADFPSISYVLAYDVDRVVQALGTSGDNDRRAERGRAYLEKIVQFQIRLPTTLATELSDLLTAEITKLENDVGLPPTWDSMNRFHELINIAIPHCVATPRDISRLVSTYHVIGSMVKGEVEWCDLLAFCILMIKAPSVTEKLARQPDLVVEDPVDYKIYMERHEQRQLKPNERLENFISGEDLGVGLVNILSFLFQLFASTTGLESRSPESLFYRRPLLTVLRLGLLGRRCESVYSV